MTPRPKAGQGGSWWHRVGTAFEGDKGITVYLDSSPYPDAEGKVKLMLFEPRERTPSGSTGSGSTTRTAPSRPLREDLDDEIPF